MTRQRAACRLHGADVLHARLVARAAAKVADGGLILGDSAHVAMEASAAASAALPPPGRARSRRREG